MSLNESAGRIRAAVSAIEAAGGLATPRELAEEWGVSEQALGERIARGTFPAPVKVAGRVRLYLRDQVEGYRPDRQYAGGELVPVDGQYAVVDGRGTSGGIRRRLSTGDRFPPPRPGYLWVLARATPVPPPIPTVAR
jgi:hypothetical protein